jgi:golgin subfamily B member 1
MSNLPAALVESLRLRRAVLVAGGRCATLAKLPGWRDLALSLVDWVDEGPRRDEVKSLVEGGRTLAALGRARELLAADVITEVVADAQPAGKSLPPAFEAAARIPWRGVITTGLDDLWTRALGAGDERMPTTALDPGQAVALDGLRGRFLLHLLGRAAAPASLCLGARDLRDKVARTATGPMVLDAHGRWSFVFVGFVAGDPDLTLVAERLLGGSASTVEHFWLLPGAPGAADVDAAGAELAVTPVAVGEGTEAAAALQALADAWDQVEGAARPTEDDVRGWLDLWTRDPADAEPRAVLDRAAEKMRQEKSWEALVDLQVHRAELLTDQAEQIAALREVAKVLEVELDGAERAYRTLVTALRLNRDDPGLVADLKRVARKANVWEEFLGEYGGIVENLADPSDSTHHVLEMGRIYAEDAGRRDKAIASFERALSLDPGSADALGALEALYRQAERWSDLVRVLEARDARATDPVERRRLRKERAEVLADKLRDAKAAAAVLEAAVTDDPDDRAALETLEALYREQKREPERLVALEKLVFLAENDQERLTLLRRLAAGYKLLPDGAAPAQAALEKAFALGDRDEETLEALSHHYQRQQSWRSSVEVLDRWAEVAEDPAVRAELLARAGKISLDKLMDLSAAEERYNRALEQDAENPSVLSALAILSRDRGDFFRAAKFLLECEERTKSPLEKARLLYEAAVLHQDRLDDVERATELYARAVAEDPEHVAAAERLVPLYEKTLSWPALEPILDMLVRKSEKPDTVVAELQRLLAETTRKLAKRDKAVKAYEAARALAPQSMPVLSGLADLHMERHAWADARAICEVIRGLPADKLTAHDRVDLFARLGRCQAHLGEAAEALRWFREAVALEAPVEIRVRLHEEIGDLCLERLGRPEEAIKAFEQVLTLQPARRPALHKVLRLYTEGKHWTGAIATLGRLAGLEASPTLRAKYAYASAVIHRDELRQPDAALELFNQALDDDPEMARAFEAIERLCTEAQDWKALTRQYRKMIKRLPADAQNELRARLWNSLGVVSLRNLKDREAAILALEVAASLDRENLARHELLADLYLDVGPSAVEKAVAEHQFLISRRPDRLESYKALAALFQQMQAYDKLWCVSGALTVLGQADHYLKSFWDRHRLPEVPVALSKIGPDQWQHIIHPREDPLIAALFNLLAPAIAMTTAQKHQAIGVKSGDRVDTSRDDWFPGVALRYVSQTMELNTPDVFVKEKDPQTVSIYNLREKDRLMPSLVLGGGFQQWSSQWEVVFDLAKRVAFMRWERYPRFALMTPTALDIAVRASLALVGCPIGQGPHNGEVEKTRSKLAELVPKPLADEVAVVARRFLEARGEVDVIDIPGWMAAADLSAARAAFVVSSDLPAAVRVLTAEPAGLSPLGLQDRIKDLIGFSVSPEYFAVREALGLQVM